MTKEQEILQKIDILLDQLVENAAELEKISEQVISEEQLIPLQRRQEELIKQLSQLDADYHIQFLNAKGKTSPIRESIHNKLASFQKLNTLFIQNLSDSHGLIHFDNHEFKRKEDFRKDKK